MEQDKKIIQSIEELKIKYFMQQAKLLDSLFQNSEITKIIFKLKKLDYGDIYEILSLENEHGTLDIELYTEQDEASQKNMAFQSKFKVQSITHSLNIFDVLSTEFLQRFDYGEQNDGLELNLQSIQETQMELIK